MDKNKYNRFLTVCLIAVLCVLVSLASFVFAKYYTKIIKENGISAAKMVVICTDNNGKTYDNGKTYYALEGNDMTFYLSNHDLGVGSNVYIEYSVELKINGVTEESKVGTFAKDVTSTNQIVNIPSIENVTYTVSIIVTEPFVKEITFSLVSIPKEHATYYDLKDHGDYVQLDLFVGKLDVDNIPVSIDYAELSPDNANPLMKDWLKESEGTITASPYSHYTLHFAKNGDLKTYKDVSGQTLDSPYNIKFEAEP